MLFDDEMLEALNGFAAGCEDLIFLVNGASCIEYLNTSASRFIGAEEGLVRGRSCSDFLCRGNHGPLDKNLREVLKFGKAVSFENKFVLPDRQITLDMRLSPVRNTGSSVQGALVIARDVSELRCEQEMIARSRRQWVRAVDGMPHSLAVVSPTHKIDRVNKAMALRLKSTVRDAIGLTCYEQFHGTAEPPQFCPFLNAGAPEDYTAEVIEPHLGEACVSSVSSIGDEAGKTVGCLYVCREIGKSERALSAKRGNEEYMRMFLRTSENLVYVQNTDGRYVYFNAMPGDRVPLGLIGSSPVEFFEPKVALKILGRVMEVATQGSEIDQEIDFLCNGEMLRFFDRVSPVKDAHGRIKAVMTVSVRKASFKPFEKQGAPKKSSQKNLTARELEILRLIAGGLTSSQIAAGLSLSKKTVETHRARIMGKLNQHKTSALVSYAARAGLLE